MVYFLSIGLRGVGLALSAIFSFLVNIGAIVGTLFFGIFIGILGWTILDLIIGFFQDRPIFQDRPTQWTNTGISFVSVIIPLFPTTYLNYGGGMGLILSGIVAGVAIAAFLDWKDKPRRRRR